MSEPRFLRQVPRQVLLFCCAASIWACAPEQDGAFCARSADCRAGYVCNAFTNRCLFDVAQRQTSFQAWGSFYCLERTELKDARGYMILGLDPATVAALGIEITDGFEIGYLATTCALGFLADPKVWFTGSSITFTALSKRLVMQLYIAERNFASGTTQTTLPEGAFALAFVDLDQNKPVLTSTDVRISVEQTVMDKTPRGVVGEFRAKISAGQ
ncbi:MAG: hypothetical protein H6707_15325 [Deltaproteobacteria bacterium]|nr:hypothetical protein [Deltaproteobacteria bacterium]